MKRLKIERRGPNEQIVWREILRDTESRYDHRLHGVLAVVRGLSCYEAAAIWGKSPRAIEYWVKRFSDGGIEGLREKSRPGRPSSLTQPQQALLDADLRRGPQAAGYEARKWSGRLLKEHLLQSYDVEIGLRQCQRLIKEAEVEPTSEKN
jgi:transposase